MTAGSGVFRHEAPDRVGLRIDPILVDILVGDLQGCGDAEDHDFGTGASRTSIGIVIIGGFLAASILTLFLTSVLYDILQRGRDTELQNTGRTA